MKETKGERILNMILRGLLIIFIILLAATACGALKGDRYHEEAKAISDDYPKYAGVENYTVQGNDTLLSIACKYCPMNADLYRYVRDVERLNGRENDTVYWKETIKVYTFD